MPRPAIEGPAADPPRFSWTPGPTSTRRGHSSGAGPEEPPLDVLIVVLDDVGIDKVRSYSPDAADLAPQPTLDRLAAEGMRFHHAYAQPSCSPARAALLTGRHARRTGLGVWLPPGTTWELPLEEITLPEMLDEAPVSWSTAAFGKWHLADALSPSGRDHANRQGFDRFVGMMSNPCSDPDCYFRWRKVVDGDVEPCTTYATTANVDDALAWVSTAPEPWLVYLAFNAAHAPYHRPPDDLHTLDERGLRPPITDSVAHGALLEAMDTELGRLLDTLDPEVLGRTLVIVVGDNGTPGPAIVPPFDPRRGKGRVTEHGVRVPLIVAGPVVGEPGATSEALVHFVDLFPTVAELAGVDLARAPFDAKPRDGVSLVPLLVDPSGPGPREYLYADTFEPLGPPPWSVDHRTLRDDRWKLVVAKEEGGSRTALFDLWSDPVDEGTPLPLDDLDAPQRQAYDRLRAELDRLSTEVVFDPDYL